MEMLDESVFYNLRTAKRLADGGFLEPFLKQGGGRGGGQGGGEAAGSGGLLRACLGRGRVRFSWRYRVLESGK